MSTISPKPWLLFLAILGGLGLAPPAQAGSARGCWINNLKQIGLAIHNYHDTYRRLPDDIVDAQGKPLLSWRVSILPFVEGEPLYKKFRLQEPWDSPHNLQLLTETPPVYQCPRYALKPGLVSFTAPRGVGTMWGAPDARGAKRNWKIIRDDPSFTLMLVEVAPENAYIWTKPDDLLYDAKNPLRGLSQEWTMGGPRDRGGFVVDAGCTVSFLPAAAEEDFVRAFFSAAGGEEFPGFLAPVPLRQVPLPYPLNWITWISLAFSVLATLGGLWTFGRFMRGLETAPGEWLWLIVGSQQAVFLVSFTCFYYLGMAPVFWREHGHLVLWFFPRLAGAVASLAALRAWWRSPEWRCLFAGGLFWLALATMDAWIPHQARCDEESLLTIAAPFVMGGFSVAMAIVTWSNPTYPGQPTRRFAHWLGIGMALFPALWFCWWFFQLDWVPLRLWFDLIPKVRE